MYFVERRRAVAEKELQYLQAAAGAAAEESKAAKSRTQAAAVMFKTTEQELKAMIERAQVELKGIYHNLLYAPLRYPNRSERKTRRIRSSFCTQHFECPLSDTYFGCV